MSNNTIYIYIIERFLNNKLKSGTVGRYSLIFVDPEIEPPLLPVIIDGTPMITHICQSVLSAVTRTVCFGFCNMSFDL